MPRCARPLASRFLPRDRDGEDKVSRAYRCAVTTSSVTDVSPENCKTLAAAGDTSMMRPLLNGPRSLMRTTTVRPLRRLVTRTIVPNGKVRCAAVSFSDTKRSPLEVVPPTWVQIEATPGFSAANEGPAMNKTATGNAPPPRNPTKNRAKPDTPRRIARPLSPARGSTNGLFRAPYAATPPLLIKLRQICSIAHS